MSFTRPAIRLALIGLVGCSWYVTEDDRFRAADRDRDGYAAIEAGGDDCLDSNPRVNPNQPELCDDGLDNDCDGVVDTFGENQVVWYQDADGDGFGDPDITLEACATFVDTNWVPNNTDCDDGNSLRHPGIIDDDCDGVDDNCSGLADDDAELTTFYADVDGDGFGDPAVPLPACAPPKGSAMVDTDCDDSDALVYPKAVEFCDGLDNDCNGYPDDDFSITATRSGVNYLKISDALNDARDGDVVDICPRDVFLGLPLVWSQSGDVTLRGTLGREETTLQRAAGGTVLEATNGKVTLEGLSVVDGRAEQSLRFPSSDADLISARLRKSERGSSTGINLVNTARRQRAYMVVEDSNIVSDNRSVGPAAGGIRIVAQAEVSRPRSLEQRFPTTRLTHTTQPIQFRMHPGVL